MDVNVIVNGANQNSAATQQDAVSNRKDKDEAAFAFANGCRDKEIDRFWSRGLYFWGFIAASFAAYMAVFALALGHDGEGQKALTLENILGMSYISRLTLFVLAFICFVFCLSWQLAHKASKYWQVNWEEYLISFEEKYLGQQIYGKPKNDNQKNYSVCPLSVEPWDYSVSKISSLCAILLMLASFLLVLFHGVCLLMEKSFFMEILPFIQDNAMEFSFVVIGLAGVFLYSYFKRCIGNKNRNHKSCC